jgi:hypothetical protein
MSFTTIEQAHRQAAEREEKRNPLASKMSLRDHFAAKAYKQADAMLKAREA